MTISDLTIRQHTWGDLRAQWENLKVDVDSAIQDNRDGICFFPFDLARALDDLESRVVKAWQEVEMYPPVGWAETPRAARFSRPPDKDVLYELRRYKKI